LPANLLRSGASGLRNAHDVRLEAGSGNQVSGAGCSDCADFGQSTLPPSELVFVDAHFGFGTALDDLLWTMRILVRPKVFMMADHLAGRRENDPVGRLHLSRCGAHAAAELTNFPLTAIKKSAWKRRLRRHGCTAGFALLMSRPDSASRHR